MTLETEKAVEELKSQIKSFKEVVYANISRTNETLAEVSTNIAILINTMKNVDEQTKKTNGRVSETEKNLYSLEKKHIQCPINGIVEKIGKIERNDEKVDEILLDAKFKQRYPEEVKKINLGNGIIIITALLAAVSVIMNLIDKL